MSFPKVQQPLFSTTLPASGKQVKFRQLTVREEKLLLTAQASQSDTVDTSAILLALKQLLTNCVEADAEFDVDKLPAVDLEWLFLQIRSKSVSNVIELQLRDPVTAELPEAQQKRIPVRICLDDVQMHASSHPRKFLLSETQNIGIIMRHPTFEMMQKIDQKSLLYQGDEDTTGLQLAVIEECMEATWEGETVYPVSGAGIGEVQEFLVSLNQQQIEKITAFLDDQPYLFLDVPYKDSMGGEQLLKLQGLADFFG